MKNLALEVYHPDRDFLPSVDVSLICMEVHESKLSQYEETEESMFEMSYKETLLDELNLLLRKKYPSLHLTASLEGRSGKHLCLDGDFWLSYCHDYRQGEICGYKLNADSLGKLRASRFAVATFQKEASRLYTEYRKFWESPEEGEA